MDYESKTMEYRGLHTIKKSFAGFYHVFLTPNDAYVAGFEYLRDARAFVDYRNNGGTLLPYYGKA
jgi:hypothetical protein